MVLFRLSKNSQSLPVQGSARLSTAFRYPHMSKLVNDYVRRQYDYVVCLVDMDRLLAHPAEMETYKHLKSKSDSCVMWVETNPCTEFWFLLHFLPSLAIRHFPEAYSGLQGKILTG